MNMETTAHTICASCVQSYQGADLNLRCRINGLKASQANADDCKRFEYCPGSDADEINWCGSAAIRGRVS